MISYDPWRCSVGWDGAQALGRGGPLVALADRLHRDTEVNHCALTTAQRFTIDCMRIERCTLAEALIAAVGYSPAAELATAVVAEWRSMDRFWEGWTSGF